MEDPGSLGVRQELHYWGVATPPVPVDAGGLRVDELRATGAPAVVLASEADLVENESVLHRGLAARIRRAGDRDVAGRRPPVTAASAGGAGCDTSKVLDDIRRQESGCQQQC